MPFTLIRSLDFEANQAFPNPPGFHPQSAYADRIPQVVTLSDGDFLVVWRVPANTLLDPDRPQGVGVQRFNPDGTPDGAAQFLAGPVVPLVAAQPGGGYVLASASGWTLYDAAGAATSSGSLSGAPAESIAALDGGGWVVVGWVETSPGVYDVVAQEFSATGVAGAVVPLNDAPGTDPDGVEVTALDGGGYAVTWTDDPAGADRELHIWNNGTDTVLDGVSRIYEDVDIAQLADGRLLVTFPMAVPASPLIDMFAAFVNLDGSVTAPFFLANVDIDLSPKILPLPDGSFIVAWAASTEDHALIVGKIYDSTGTAIPDTTFSVGNTLTGEDFSLSLVDDSHFVVTWMAWGGGDNTLNGTIYAFGSGTPWVGTPGNDTFTGGQFGDDAQGLGGNDYLAGYGGRDILDGGEGNDVIEGGAGDDWMIGGAGNDVFYVHSAGDSVTEAVGGGTDGVYASVDYVLAAGQEVEVLSTISHAAVAHINLTGNEFAQIIQGNAGNNVLRGGGGADLMAGFGGNDIYYVDDSSQRVGEAVGGGNDEIRASVSFVLGGAEEVEIIGTANAAGTDAINLTGSNRNQTITGNAGNNILHGGGGVDILVGLAGNDIYFTDVAGTQVIEALGGGNDALYTSVSYTLAVNQSVELLSANSYAATTAINLTGNNLDQTIVGNAGVNILHGGGGTDLLIGYGGNDIYYVDVASTRVEEYANGGNDAVYTSVSYALALGSNASIETLSTNNTAATTAINLTGNTFAQTIVGNAGDNVIDGNGGGDILYGMGGSDTFVFDLNEKPGVNLVRIMDFDPASDVIRLADGRFPQIGVGPLAAGAFVTGAAPGDANDRILYDPTTGFLYYDRDGTGAAPTVHFATLSTGLAVTAADFVIF